MSSEKRPESLATQAAAWVPPWERPHRPPDRAYQADLVARDDDGAPSDGDVDDTPPELAPLPGESAEPGIVDAPAERPEEGEAAPTEVADAPEVPLPAPLEEAAEQAPESEPSESVDAPVPAEGDGDDEDEERAAGAASTFRNPVPAQGRGSQGLTGARTPVPGFSPDDEAAPDDQGDQSLGLTLMDDAELRAALEAILLVVDEPVAEMQLAQIMEQPTERVAAMLEDISARYTAAGHGFDLRRAAGGWRLYTRPEYAAYVERFVLDGQSVRLTQAALETLAVVAYKQPVTRSRISAIRGVNCDGVMRTLVTRGLIEECGIEGETGAYLYRTTPLFLEKLGLNSVDQLPPLAPFLPDDVEEVLDASG